MIPSEDSMNTYMKGSIDCAVKIIKNDGFMSTMKEAGANILRGVAGANILRAVAGAGVLAGFVQVPRTLHCMACRKSINLRIVPLTRHYNYVEIE
ncbi:ADP/ATP carrier protein [Biomphalaria glabrata]